MTAASGKFLRATGHPGDAMQPPPASHWGRQQRRRHEPTDSRLHIDGGVGRNGGHPDHSLHRPAQLWPAPGQAPATCGHQRTARATGSGAELGHFTGGIHRHLPIDQSTGLRPGYRMERQLDHLCRSRRQPPAGPEQRHPDNVTSPWRRTAPHPVVCRAAADALLLRRPSRRQQPHIPAVQPPSRGGQGRRQRHRTSALGQSGGSPPVRALANRAQTLASQERCAYNTRLARIAQPVRALDC